MATGPVKSRRKLLAEMNVVPYIDVMLVMVVILMVAAPYVNPSMVDLPKVQKAARQPDKVVQVIVMPDGRLSLKSEDGIKPIDFPSLVAEVEAQQKQGEQIPVVIAADKTVAYEKVIDVMRQLQKANINRVGLSLEVEQGAR
ncbi:MAG: biopolymer transporter ExbD [Burkholderiales bacterium]|nr:biopolymer transporter ExbD [Burkholderiales bacterium]